MPQSDPYVRGDTTKGGTMSECEQARAALRTAVEYRTAAKGRLQALTQIASEYDGPVSSADRGVTNAKTKVTSAEKALQSARAAVGKYSSFYSGKVRARDAALVASTSARTAWENAQRNGSSQLEIDALHTVWKPLAATADALIEEVNETKAEEDRAHAAAVTEAESALKTANEALSDAEGVLRDAKQRRSEYDKRVAEREREVASAQSDVEGKQFAVEMACD